MNWNDLLQWIVFIVCAALVLGGALGMTLTMSMYRAGLSLMLCLVAMAGLFVLLEADMLAVIQVMMNVGGMLVMTLFMVMLMQDPGGEMMWDMKRKMQMPGFAALSMFMPPKPKEVASKNSSPDSLNQMVAQNGAKMKMTQTNKSEEMKMAAQNQDGMIKPSSSDPHRRLREIQQAMAVMQQQLVALEEELDQPPTATGSGNMDGMHHSNQPNMSSQGQSGSSAQTQPTFYTCPMHPEVRSDKPGRCPKCGMDLVPVEGSDSSSGSGSDEHSGHQTMSGMRQASSSDGSGSMAGMPGMISGAGGDGSMNMDMTVASMQKRDPKGYYKMMEGMAMSTGQLKLAGIFSVITGLVLVFLIARVAWLPKSPALDLDGPTRVGDLLLSDYMMAFEGAALLILAGIVGAVVLARRERNRPQKKKQSRIASTNLVAPKHTQDNTPALSKPYLQNFRVVQKAVASYKAASPSGTTTQEVG